MFGDNESVSSTGTRATIRELRKEHEQWLKETYESDGDIYAYKRVINLLIWAYKVVMPIVGINLIGNRDCQGCDDLATWQGLLVFMTVVHLASAGYDLTEAIHSCYSGCTRAQISSEDKVQDSEREEDDQISLESKSNQEQESLARWMYNKFYDKFLEKKTSYKTVSDDFDFGDIAVERVEHDNQIERRDRNYLLAIRAWGFFMGVAKIIFSGVALGMSNTPNCQNYPDCDLNSWQGTLIAMYVGILLSGSNNLLDGLCSFRQNPEEKSWSTWLCNTLWCVKENLANRWTQYSTRNETPPEGLLP